MIEGGRQVFGCWMGWIGLDFDDGLEMDFCGGRGVEMGVRRYFGVK